MCESQNIPMPAILTLRCCWCDKLMVLRGEKAEFARDQFRRDGQHVEFGDTVTISTCGAPSCDQADFLAYAFSL